MPKAPVGFVRLGKGVWEVTVYAEYASAPLGWNVLEAGIANVEVYGETGVPLASTYYTTDLEAFIGDLANVAKQIVQLANIPVGSLEDLMKAIGVLKESASTIQSEWKCVRKAGLLVLTASPESVKERFRVCLDMPGTTGHFFAMFRVVCEEDDKCYVYDYKGNRYLVGGRLAVIKQDVKVGDTVLHGDVTVTMISSGGGISGVEVERIAIGVGAAAMAAAATYYKTREPIPAAVAGGVVGVAGYVLGPELYRRLSEVFREARKRWT